MADMGDYTLIILDDAGAFVRLADDDEERAARRGDEVGNLQHGQYAKYATDSAIALLRDGRARKHRDGRFEVIAT